MRTILLLPKCCVCPSKTSVPPSKYASTSFDTVCRTLIFVSVILIAAVESDFKFKNLFPSASVPALDTENLAPLYFKLFTVEVVVSNSPAMCTSVGKVVELIVLSGSFIKTLRVPLASWTIVLPLTAFTSNALSKTFSSGEEL